VIDRWVPGATGTESVLSAYFDAIDGEDYHAAGRLFSVEGELLAPGTAGCRGPEAVAAYFTAALAPFPVHNDIPTRVLLSGRSATVEISFRAELRGGTPFGFEAVDVFDLDDRLQIVRLSSWYDSHAVRRALAGSR
jgi:hypothetical protein